jgi:hypothetical protein
MLAEAQQSGLFPLAPIRRQRIPCPMEDPVYGLYRQEYFGYHPTCWRKFPAGWGCPSAEGPNAAASFDPKQGGRPRDPAPAMLQTDDFGAPAEPGMEGPPLPGEPSGDALPPLPENRRSPFDLDTKPTTPPPAPPADGGAPPAGGDNPLELPPPVNAPDRAEDAPLPGLPPAGRIDPPAVGAEEESPLLALPDPVPAASTPTPPAAVVSPRPIAGPMAPSAFATPAPVQAPRRTSLLGGLFGGIRRR